MNYELMINYLKILKQYEEELKDTVENRYLELYGVNPISGRCMEIVDHSVDHIQYVIRDGSVYVESRAIPLTILLMDEEEYQRYLTVHPKQVVRRFGRAI